MKHHQNKPCNKTGIPQYHHVRCRDTLIAEQVSSKSAPAAARGTTPPSSEPTDASRTPAYRIRARQTAQAPARGLPEETARGPARAPLPLGRLRLGRARWPPGRMRWRAPAQCRGMSGRGRSPLSGSMRMSSGVAFTCMHALNALQLHPVWMQPCCRECPASACTGMQTSEQQIGAGSGQGRTGLGHGGQAAVGALAGDSARRGSRRHCAEADVAVLECLQRRHPSTVVHSFSG